MGSEAHVTTDHEEIRQWAEARGGRPARVTATGDGDAGVLRFDFPEYGNEGDLEDISWDQFFEKFEAERLALVYQEETKEGAESRFGKLINRDSRQAARREQPCAPTLTTR